MSYNGWKNYETWCVGLWIDNEQSTYHETREALREIAEQAEATRYSTAEEQARTDAAEWLQEYVQESMPDLGATMASDLLSAALQEVEWRELAESWLSEVREVGLGK